MDPLTLALILGGTGLLKGLTSDRNKEARDRELQAKTAQYSPWTGLRPRDVQEADPFGNMLKYGATGAMLGQNLQAQPKDTGLSAWSSQRELAGSPKVAYMDPVTGMTELDLPLYGMPRR